MNDAIRAEVFLLFASLLLGLKLMAVYDGLRVFRMLVPHGLGWTGLEDMLYWLYAGISVFLLLLEQNDGILRGYAILGVLAGMLLYHMTISRILLGGLKKGRKYFTMKKRQRRKEGDRDGRDAAGAGKRTCQKKEKRKPE